MKVERLSTDMGHTACGFRKIEFSAQNKSIYFIGHLQCLNNNFQMISHNDNREGYQKKFQRRKRGLNSAADVYECAARTYSNHVLSEVSLLNEVIYLILFL